MVGLLELIANIERWSKTDGCSTVTFPTLEQLSINGKAFGTTQEICSLLSCKTSPSTFSLKSIQNSVGVTDEFIPGAVVDHTCHLLV